MESKCDQGLSMGLDLELQPTAQVVDNPHVGMEQPALQDLVYLLICCKT